MCKHAWSVPGFRGIQIAPIAISSAGTMVINTSSACRPNCIITEGKTLPAVEVEHVCKRFSAVFCVNFLMALIDAVLRMSRSGQCACKWLRHAVNSASWPAEQMSPMMYICALLTAELNLAAHTGALGRDGTRK